MSYSTIGTVVGGAIGFYVGGPTGAQWGAALGGAAGGVVDQNQIPDNKLADTKAAKVSLGAPIALLFGHPRSGGNLIWCSEAIESGEEGAKGGGPTTTNYVRNILLKLSDDYCGPITRIWFGGKLVYNALATADDATIDASIEDGQIGEVINYNGGPTQMPDSTYAAAVGNENALAYRGCSTAALLRVACGSSGQLPPITVEVAGKDAGTNIGVTSKIKTNFAEADFRASPPEGSTVPGTRVTAVTGSAVLTYNTNGDIASNNVPTGIDLRNPGSGNGDRAISVFGTPGGTCLVGVAGDDITSRVIAIDDPEGYLGTSQIRFSTYGGDIAIGSTIHYTGAADTSIPGQNYPGALGYLGLVYVYSLEGVLIEKVDIQADITDLDSVAMSRNGLWAFGNGVILAFDRDAGYANVDSFAPPAGSNHRIFITKEGVLACANADAELYRRIADEWVLFATMDDALDSEGDPIDLGTNVAHHAIRGSACYAVKTKQDVPVTEGKRITYFYDSSWGDVDGHRRQSWQECLNDALYVDGYTHLGSPRGRAYSYFIGLSAERQSRNEGYSLVSDEPWPLPDSETRQIIVLVTDMRMYGYLGDFEWPILAMYPASYTLTFYQVYRNIEPGDPDPKFYVDLYRKRLDVDLYELTEPTLQEVVEDLCIRADIPADRVDATDLATKKVHALAVSQVGPTTSTLEMLGVVYKFYCTESGGKLVFKFFGDAPVRTLAYSDLGASFGDSPANALPFSRSNESEIPSMESARFANIDNDYQDGLESSDRLNASTQSATVSEYPIGLTPDEGKQLAVTNQQIRVASLKRFTFSVGPENRDLEPGDSIMAPDDKGNLFQIFLQKIGFDRGVLTIDGVSEDTSAYTSDATTANTYTNSTTVRPPPATEFEILDIPLLSDESDVPHFHVVAKPESFPWSGYSFQRSPDDISYSEIYQDNSIGIFGTCSTTLAQWTGGRVVDWASSVTVNVGSGQLSSITRAGLITSRANLAMVGSELLQFQTAELVTTGVYVLSGFARYLGGTDWVGHGPGERFVLLKASSLETVNLNLADQGILRYYKAVTLGRNPNTADGEGFSPELVSMKPVAPANVRTILRPNGDVLLRWIRRTRYQSNSLRGIVPLGEAAEAYTVQIYDGPTLLRTINTTATEAVYTSAMQVTDGVSSGTDPIARIRQVGAVQGYPAELTLEL